MNGLILVSCALLAVAAAAPSGILGGAVVAGPAGIVTNHGAIGPAAVGHGLGLGWGNRAIVAGPVGGLGLGLGLGLGHGIVGLGASAITNGGGVIGASAHGATIAGPGTAPVVIAGPSGKVAADGLWGPTGNVGLLGHGHW